MSNGKLMNNFMGWIYHNLPRLYKEYGKGGRINAPEHDIDKIRTDWIKENGYHMNKEDFIFINKLIKGLICDNMEIGRDYEFLAIYTPYYERRYLR